MTREEINKKLRNGDHITIAEMAGNVTSDYVRMVLAGKRKSEKVIIAAQTLIENRKQLIADFQQR